MPVRFSEEGWAKIVVELAVDGFRGTIEPYLESDDLARFRAQLQLLYDTLSGTAEIRPVEKQFNLSLQGDGRGKVIVSGTATTVERRTTLAFAFDIDQTFLVEPLAQLQSLYERAPSA